MYAAENELKRFLENKGKFVLNSSGSRSPVDVASFSKKAAIFYQVKETRKGEIYVGDEIKKLDEVSQKTGVISVVAVKFIGKDGSVAWSYCPTDCLVQNGIVTISEDEKDCCIKKEGVR